MLQNLKKNPLKGLLLPLFAIMQLAYTAVQIVQYKPEAVHAHWIVPQGLSVYLAKKITRSSVPFLLTSHGADLYGLNGRFFRAIKGLVVRAAQVTTVVSRTMVGEIFDLGATEDKVRVLPMGVDLDHRFVPSAFSKKRFEILFVGRLVEKKGVKYLIEAMPVVVASHPRAVLRIVGYGPEEASLRRRITQLSLSNHIKLVGAISQNELPEMYQNASVFVAPFVKAKGGDQEGFGLVLVEALGCGCRLVVSDMPATKDSLSDINFVRVVPQRDPGALAAAIVTELSGTDDPLFFDRSRLVNRFGWDSVALRYSEMLKNLEVS
jgi:glycosyltransferase involved in cell wall biosynthesis